METINLTKQQLLSISNYKKVGIEIELDGDIVKITQKRLFNGYILNQKQLIERAREIFPDMKVHPVAFSLDVSQITTEWIESRMKEFGIKRNDLIKQLALDKSYLSLLFADEDNPRKINLSRQVRSMFFYYFLTYELNRDFRS
ncbi:MAG: hypothetical protein WCY16_10145 [Weeksellaceae bacterium]